MAAAQVIPLRTRKRGQTPASKCRSDRSTNHRSAALTESTDLGKDYQLGLNILGRWLRTGHFDGVKGAK